MLMDESSVTREAHHAAPRCLISLHERANGTSLDGEGIQAWLEWEWEATRWRVPVEISRDELEALVERSAVVLERERHRLVHGEDWRRRGTGGSCAKRTAARTNGRWSTVGASSAPTRWAREGSGLSPRPTALSPPSCCRRSTRVACELCGGGDAWLKTCLMPQGSRLTVCDPCYAEHQAELTIVMGDRLVT